MSRISVIIPTYNRAALLREAIESVLAQTRAADEIIVVDDGSTDGTRAAVAALDPNDGRLRYVWQPNAFQSAARNNGVRHTTGDLLLFLDSDDRLLPDALGRLEAAIAARPDAALAYGRACLIDTSGALVQDRWEQEDHDGHVWDRLIARNFLASPGCALVRRAHLEGASPWDETLRGTEDWDLWLRLAEDAPFVRVREAVLDYRVHPGTISRDEQAMNVMNLRLYDKHLATHEAAGNLARAARVRTLRETLARRTHDSDAPERDRLQWHHRVGRVLLETFGLAALYRRVPFETRLRVRRALGIDRWA